MELTPEALAALRLDYSQRGLMETDLAPDPFEQFKRWLDEAAMRGMIEPNAMTFSTVDSEGQPWSRIVLLKALDVRGFTFFTNYTGRKGTQLAHNPLGALTFWWGALERQVNVTGRVDFVSREESEAYFHSRPRASQIGAWASPQSEPIPDRTLLEQRYAEFDARYENSEIPLPPHWGGYRLLPSTIEFWQGRRSRLHDRIFFQRSSENAPWERARLAP
jgi:pyridoxamine 5'-phosphate oxidase